ncbi:MAG: DUF1697 domain-containing protein [Chitinophagales bacterium]|nr:DUF1697 domain-containing protein [Chitinophagales bacterium]
MTTYITILRGINVSGRNKIKMADLRKILDETGLKNVQTYIQSGNIVYQHEAIDTKVLSKLIKNKIAEVYDYDVPVITLTSDALATIARTHPYPTDDAKDPAYCHITFLADEPIPESISQIKPEDYQPDEFQIIGKAVYLYCPNGYGKTKLNNSFWEKKLKVTATTRNWKTTNKLVEMVNVQ